MTTIGTARVVDCRISEASLAGVPYLAARFDVDVVTSGPVQLAALMDAIKAKVPDAATKRVYAWPVEDAAPPCAIVSYPDSAIDFDLTMGRGADRLTIPVFFLVGKAVERTARDALSAILTGASGIKTAIDGDLTTETP